MFLKKGADHHVKIEVHAKPSRMVLSAYTRDGKIPTWNINRHLPRDVLARVLVASEQLGVKPQLARSPDSKPHQNRALIHTLMAQLQKNR